MPVQRYRPRARTVEALQWTGENSEEMRAFAGADFDLDPDSDTEDDAEVRTHAHSAWEPIYTGWWAVKDERGLSVVSAEDFAAAFELMDADSLKTAVVEALDQVRAEMAAMGWPRVEG